MSQSIPEKSRFPWGILIGVAVLGGVAIFALPMLSAGFGGPEIDSALTHEAQKDELLITVTEEGNVESASNVDVKCQVAGGSSILWIIPDGEQVKKGDKIVELDSAALEEQINTQRIAFEKARATKIQSEKTFSVAKISVTEYLEGTFKQLLQDADALITISEENLRSSKNSLDHSQRMFRKGYVSNLELGSKADAVKHAELEDPVIVGHSMGGAIALLVGHKLGRRVSHIGIIASSAFWVRPKVAVTLAAAPYVMAPNSPIIIRRQHRQAIQVPQEAGRVVWEYAARPARSTLEATARALKSFDARKWDRSDMAPITWMVTKADGIIDPDEQLTSARIFTEDIVEVQAEHSVVMDNPDIVAPFLERLGARRTFQPTDQVVDL